jgi:hypothetical protein
MPAVDPMKEFTKSPVRSATLSSGMVMLFAATVGLSAALLFTIQPMFAKMLLPLVGGAPAVWNTVVLFFQLALLVGYLAAHVLRNAFSLRPQILLYIFLTATAALALPLRIGVNQLNAVQQPVAFVLTALLIGAGLPFLAISILSPLLQSWFARLGHGRSGDPYFLYAASNAGSLLGLATYPLVLEPVFDISTQSRIWSAAYFTLAGCVCACGAVAWFFGTGNTQENGTAADREPISWSSRVRWITFAFVPASLSLAMTTYITNEIAPIPLLWTLPLGVYLLTFIIAFSARPLLTPGSVKRVLPYGILPLVLLFSLGGALPDGIDCLLNLVALFLVGVSCHGELAQSRPHTQNLTTFYLFISLGGALGGLFNAIVAPHFFPTVLEYPLMIVVACAVLPAFGQFSATAKAGFSELATATLFGGILFLALQAADLNDPLGIGSKLCFGVSILVCFSFIGRRLRFAAAIAAVFIVAGFVPYQGDQILAAERDFFGAKLVTYNAQTGLREFIHSGTVHGIEAISPSFQRVPLAYYSTDGPLGAIFREIDRKVDSSIGVVGLGIGTIACYRKLGERWTFFEIDTQVVSIARDPRLFSYMSLCAPHARILIGDGRLELAKVPPHSYDLLVLDAYTSDQPPVHLLTHQAFSLFVRDVAANGMIAFHTSDRYFDLTHVIGNLAAGAGWSAWVDTDVTFKPTRSAKGELGSQWIVATKDSGSAGAIAHDSHWVRLSPDPGLREWTDGYSSLLLIMHLWRRD